MTNTSRAIALVVILGLILLGWFAVAHMKTPAAPAGPATTTAAPAGAVVVTLTSDGFQPAEVHITAGQTVSFRTTAGKPFWPASNPHPSHTNYPEFDPKDPIAPDATWNFTFDRVGTWGYHDHLAPYFTGTIDVQ